LRCGFSEEEFPVEAGYEDILERHPVPRRLITVAEYQLMGKVGILDEDDRVELLEGQLVKMNDIGPRHALAVDALNEILVTVFAGRATVRVQNPVTLDGISGPQPDFAVVTRRWFGYPNTHPGPADIFLLIEIADSSFKIDSGAKLEIYAKAGIREFWIVDLNSDIVRVHRKPSGITYESVKTVYPSETLEVESLPGVTFPAATIFV
jgi:Uma2 family endonuclease